MHEQMKRLYEAAKELKGIASQSGLAHALDVSPQRINNWEERGISMQGLVLTQKKIGCSAIWLQTGVGPMKVGPINENVEPGPDVRERKYPVISFVQAGIWTEICDNFQPGDAEDWRPCHKDLGRCGYVLRVKGPSMMAALGEPYTFPEGMLLFVNPNVDPVPGKFVIVRRHRTSEATFKRLIQVDGELYLEALNPAWPNRYLQLEDGDQFCGVVITAALDMP